MREEQFAQALTMRGLGFYGRDKMKEICEKSGIMLLNDDSIKINGDPIKAISKLMIIFSSGSIIAKLTVRTVAKKYDIRIPDIINSKKHPDKSNIE